MKGAHEQMTAPKILIAIRINDKHVQTIREAYPDLDLTVCTDEAALPEVLADTDAVIGWGHYDTALLSAAPKLRWVHTFGAGIDRILNPELIEGDVVVTNNAGVRGPNIAEHLLGMMLGFARRIPDYARSQMQHEWNRDRNVFEIGGQTAAVIGLGDIGQHFAWRANALGMRVIGLRRVRSELPRGVEKVYPPEQLHELLAEADHVIISAPLTPLTHHLFGAAEFAAMKPTAYIYNIGRGRIIDQDALIAALESGEIAGAGLDVTTPEPLPSDSPLWAMPNVLITCHSAGSTPYNWPRGLEIVIDNIDRFQRGEELRNVVDKRAGY